MVTIKIPDWYINLKNADSKLSYVYEKAKKALKETSIEVYICAALGLAIATGISYKIESNREKTIPLGFSEVKQLSQENMTPVTKYLTNANDIPMKVFECWNKSHNNINENSVEAFASELKSVVGSVYSSTEFVEDLKSMPKQSEEALEEMKSMVGAMNKVAYVNSKLDSAWEDTHRDHYRTETYLDTETHTDSKGNSYTVTVIKTREVYDHTHHSYDYYPDEGEESSRSLDELVKAYPNLTITEVKKVLQVSEEGKQAIRNSRKKGYNLSEEQILEIANTWNTGSTLIANLPTIYERWEQLKIDANNWRAAKNTAKSDSYQTNHSHDAGPVEFQAAETALSHGRDLFYYTKDIMRGIEYVQQNSKLLEDYIHEYIAVSLYQQPGNAKKLRSEIMNISREWYSTNFKNGLDVYPFKAYMIFLSGLLGLGLGIGAGVGIDKLGEKYGLWEKKNTNP